MHAGFTAGICRMKIRQIFSSTDKGLTSKYNLSQILFMYMGLGFFFFAMLLKGLLRVK